MDQTQLRTTPLENLVVRQLADIRKQERKLARRYQQLNAAGNPVEEMDRFSAEVTRFDEKANRLMRLIEAMEGYSVADATAMFAPVTKQ